MLLPLLVPPLSVELLLSVVPLLVEPLPLLIPLLFVLLPVAPLPVVLPSVPLLPVAPLPSLEPLPMLLPVVPLVAPLLPLVPLLSVVPLLSLDLSRVVSLVPLLLLCVPRSTSFPNAGYVLTIADMAAAAEINCLRFMLTSKKKLITPALVTRQEMPDSASLDVRHLPPMTNHLRQPTVL